MPGVSQGEIRKEELRCSPLDRDRNGGGALPQVSQGTMPASSRGLCGAADPKRRAKTPALHCGLKRALTRKRQPTARPVGGPMQASAPTQGTAALHDRHPPIMPAAPVPPPVCLAL